MSGIKSMAAVNDVPRKCMIVEATMSGDKKSPRWTMPAGAPNAMNVPTAGVNIAMLATRTSDQNCAHRNKYNRADDRVNARTTHTICTCHRMDP